MMNITYFLLVVYIEWEIQVDLKKNNSPTSPQAAYTQDTLNTNSQHTFTSINWMGIKFQSGGMVNTASCSGK